MATTTTNFGFDVPTSSDLVKNGATAISTLGQDIDTFLAGSPTRTAGKNKIINGDFYWNQRNFTSVTADGLYGFDRWTLGASDGTTTFTPQTFTPGAAPVAGYEGVNYAQIVSTGQTLSTAYSWLRQKIEDVRSFAGQTVTVSFWAKAATGTPKIAVELAQQFGSGGSSQVTTYAGQVTLSTSWARYSVSVAVPSISGKTIGTSSTIVLNLMCSAGSSFDSRSGSLGIQSNTFQFWGVQVEAGSVATAFQTATGTIQGELAACQRYYQRVTSTNSYGLLGTGKGYSANALQCFIPFPTQMRTTPSSIETSALSTIAWETGSTSGSTATSISIDTNVSNPSNLKIDINKVGAFTTGAYYSILGNNTGAAYIGWSAEL